MKKELEEKLFTKYPKLFVLREKKDTPLYPIIFGCECADGWYDLIDILCRKLQWTTDQWNNKDNPDRYPQVTIIQLKEKFGGLRFYTSGATEYQSGLISFAESMSYKICEICGTTINIGTTSGWIRTLCETCKNKHYPDAEWELNQEVI